MGCGRLSAASIFCLYTASPLPVFWWP